MHNTKFQQRNTQKKDAESFVKLARHYFVEIIRKKLISMKSLFFRRKPEMENNCFVV